MIPKFSVALLSAAFLIGQDKPLTTFPYTPSLDVPSMDKTVAPCENFYQYACGTWIQKNPIPGDQARWDVYSKLDDENKHYLWGLLQQAAAGGSARAADVQKTGDFFASCMDEDAIEKLGAKPIASDLAAIAGLKNTADLAKWLGREQLRIFGDGLMFGFGSDQDDADSSRVIGVAAAGGLGLPDRDYYSKTDAKSVEIRGRYVEHIARVLVLAGEDSAVAASEARAILALETALAGASLTMVEKRDPHATDHKMNLDALETLTPSFAWRPFLIAAGVANLREFNVTEPAFFKELERQLKAHPVADWKPYLRWQVAKANSSYLSKAFADADFDFYRKYLRGISEQAPRWKKCVRWTDSYLGEALGRVFVERTFGPELKASTLAMTKGVEQAMREEIEQLTWMSAATKKQAIAKLNTVVNKIGYPDRWRDYSSVAIRVDDFAGNVERSMLFESQRQLGKIGKPVDRGEWGITPPTINAYYNAQMNDINFPAGVLQPPLFDAKLDDAPNYGNTGATIGHELTHGFDDEGRQFDAKGNLKDWWTKQDAAEFESRVGCVRDQYAQYTVVDDIKINSKLTLGEDVADLGGTLLAYIAWKHATAGKELGVVDGLSPDQRFFVGMAQWACGSERSENLRAGAITNPHSPNQYRINGVVSNMPQFAAAFGCKVGQPMAREKSCRVW